MAIYIKCLNYSTTSVNDNHTCSRYFQMILPGEAIKDVCLLKSKKIDKGASIFPSDIAKIKRNEIKGIFLPDMIVLSTP